MAKRREDHSNLNSTRVKYARTGSREKELSSESSETGTFTQGPLDSTFGQHAAFPITQLDEDIDTTMSVQSYMELVRQEAERDSCIYYAERSENEHSNGEDEKGSDILPVNSPDNDKSDHNLTPCGKNMEHSNEWGMELIREFLRLKEDIAKYVETEKQKQQSESDLENNKESTTPIEIPETATAWRQYIVNNPPPPLSFFFFTLNRPTIIKLLIYTTKWLSANSNNNLSKWIFLLFLRLDNLLDHTDCAIVRDLAKKAIKIKSTFKPEDINETSKYTIEMVIIVVGEYYRQRDLLSYDYQDT